MSLLVYNLNGFFSVQIEFLRAIHASYYDLDTFVNNFSFSLDALDFVQLWNN